ncbi:OmpA family protein [Tsuneonella sp. YG55]|uniref:OmpA family protein n=1 Tax=Tsuneonella litorea TaxID=2976475 RepID=A0A9X2W1V8_9SPHN|nr:OmpA family protein [Tsuneonella litorea]MCT2559400.1 OmpA family protein [Tsuneonella litorea]
MKAWYLVLSLVSGVPVAAAAQTSSEDVRAAELACQLAGLCGELAQQEADRDKQEIEGVETRGLPSIGALKAASKGAPSARPKTSSSRSTASQISEASRARATRTARRNIPAASVGRAPPLARTPVAALGSTAADIPESLARRAPLFITFDVNSARLTKESVTEVKSFAKALANIQASGMDKRYRIEGHTDSTGNADFNRKLSLDRAEAVREALIAEGVEASRIEVAGYGPDQPIEGYDNTDPVNRRVEAVEIK